MSFSEVVVGFFENGALDVAQYSVGVLEKYLSRI